MKDIISIKLNVARRAANITQVELIEILRNLDAGPINRQHLGWLESGYIPPTTLMENTINKYFNTLNILGDDQTIHIRF